MMRWQYKVIDVSEHKEFAEDERALNELGADGWELVQAHSFAGGALVLFLKRPLPSLAASLQVMHFGEEAA